MEALRLVTLGPSLSYSSRRVCLHDIPRSSIRPGNGGNIQEFLLARYPSRSRSLLVRTRAPQDSAVIEAAWEILEEFNKNDVRGLEQPSLQSAQGRYALKASVIAAVEDSKVHEGCLPMLGICSNDYEEALAVLQQWTSALGCDFFPPQAIDFKQNVVGPVYIKYNPKAKVSYAQPYTGKFRGVIVQIGQKQIGHLPLALFSS